MENNRIFLFLLKFLFTEKLFATNSSTTEYKKLVQLKICCKKPIFNISRKIIKLRTKIQEGGEKANMTSFAKM
jgi:hypothetical protein